MTSRERSRELEQAKLVVQYSSVSSGSREKQAALNRQRRIIVWVVDAGKEKVRRQAIREKIARTHSHPARK